MKNHLVKTLNVFSKKYWVWAIMDKNGEQIEFYDIFDSNGENVTETYYFSSIPDEKDLIRVISEKQ